MTAAAAIGAVAIGRNEGERLVRCLAALFAQGAGRVVYVDSGSTDGSVAAARGLGASAWQTFRRVTLPLSVPGLVLAGELALVWGLGAFLGPLFLGGPAEITLSVEVHRQAFEYGRWPRAAALGVVLIGTTGGCLAAYAVLTRRGRRA